MIYIVNCGSQKTPYIEQAVDLICDYQSVGMYDLPKTDLNACAGIILSGAPILLTEIDPQPYLELFEWIKTTEKPVLGICFGHQIIGLLHGAFINLQKEDRDWQIIEQLNSCPLFDKLPDEFEMMEDHCESISVPPDFELVAVSDACINEGMQHRSKKLYGVQFHPEVSGNYGNILIENFVNICLNLSSK